MDKNITNEQIEQLLQGAGEAGDIDQAMLCALALHGEQYLVDNYSCAQDVLSLARLHNPDDLETWAREKCADAIADAAAQRDF